MFAIGVCATAGLTSQREQEMLISDIFTVFPSHQIICEKSETQTRFLLVVLQCADICLTFMWSPFKFGLHVCKLCEKYSYEYLYYPVMSHGSILVNVNESIIWWADFLSN